MMLPVHNILHEKCIYILYIRNLSSIAYIIEMEPDLS